MRWPNRRVRSIDKQLCILRAAVEDGCAEGVRGSLYYTLLVETFPEISAALTFRLPWKDDGHSAAINEQIQLLQTERNKICFIE